MPSTLAHVCQMDLSNWKEKVTPKHMSSHTEDIFLVSRISRVRETKN